MTLTQQFVQKKKKNGTTQMTSRNSLQRKTTFHHFTTVMCLFCRELKLSHGNSYLQKTMTINNVDNPGFLREKSCFGNYCLTQNSHIHPQRLPNSGWIGTDRLKFLICVRNFNLKKDKSYFQPPPTQPLVCLLNILK